MCLHRYASYIQCCQAKYIFILIDTNDTGPCISHSKLYAMFQDGSTVTVIMRLVLVDQVLSFQWDKLGTLDSLEGTTGQEGSPDIS